VQTENQRNASVITCTAAHFNADSEERSRTFAAALAIANAIL
jgi:hypothetical protein